MRESDRVLVLECVQRMGVRAVPLSDFVARTSSGVRPYPGRIVQARHQDLPRARASRAWPIWRSSPSPGWATNSPKWETVKIGAADRAEQAERRRITVTAGGRRRIYLFRIYRQMLRKHRPGDRLERTRLHHASRYRQRSPDRRRGKPATIPARTAPDGYSSGVHRARRSHVAARRGRAVGILQPRRSAGGGAGRAGVRKARHGGAGRRHQRVRPRPSTSPARSARSRAADRPGLVAGRRE